MTLALILVRWLHLSASILLASLFLFEAAIVLPAMKNSLVATGHLLETSRRLTCRTALWTLLVALISWVLWSWLVASTMTGDNLIECFQTGDWLTVLVGTQFGHIWLFRVIVSLLLGTVLWVLARRSGRRSFLQKTLVGLSVLELVSLVGAGHGTASPGPLGIVHLLADALHLLASAFWPGALVPLAAFLFLSLKSSQLEAIGLAAPVVRKFSASSLTAVASLALTGLVNTIFMVGSLPALLTSAYGQILVSKLVLFLGMIGFGAWNLFLLKPRLPVGLPIVNFAQQKSTLHSLLRNVLWEIGLATVVVLIVGWLGTTPPPTR
jgi:putative copper resistance protein D